MSVLFYSLFLSLSFQKRRFYHQKCESDWEETNLTIKLNITTKIVTAVRWDTQVSKNFRVIHLVLALC